MSDKRYSQRRWPNTPRRAPRLPALAAEVRRDPSVTLVQGQLLQTEASFQDNVAELAKWTGALYFHDRDSRLNPSGLPDTIAIIGGLQEGEPATLVFLELKREDRRPTARQREWITRLGRVTRIVAGWKRPSDWDEIKHLFGAE